MNAKLTVPNSTNDLYGEYPTVVVRVNNETSGNIVARGYGTASSYQWGIDNFDRANPQNLGSDWQQDYYFGNTGVLATPSVNGVATAMQWVPAGIDHRACIARRINSSDAKTSGDNQIINMKIGASTFAFPFFDGWSNISMYGRMSDDAKSYVRLAITYADVRLWYAKGVGAIGELPIGNAVALSTAPGDTYSFHCGYSGVSRQFALLKNGTLVPGALWTDNTQVTNVGSAYQGWGVGAEVYTATTLFIPTGQWGTPPVDTVWITDTGNAAYSDNHNYGPVTIVPEALGNQTNYLTGASTLYVRGIRAGGSSSTVTTVPGPGTLRPNLQVWTVPVA